MNLPSILQELYKILLALVMVGWQNRSRVLATITLITAAVVAFHTWHTMGQSQLVLFVGTPGSSTSRIGPVLAEEIRSRPNSNGVDFRIVTEPNLENIGLRDRMATESSRIPLGVVEDAMSSNGRDLIQLRALVPMEWDYLFVLCNRKLVEKAGANPALTLAEVIDGFKKANGKMYLGPSQSNSNRMARKVLGKFDLAIDEYQAKGIADWDELRDALKKEDVQLAFFSGPMGDANIERIGGDGKVVMLSVGNIAEAIQQETGFQYYAARFPGNLVVANAEAVPQGKSKNKIPVAFCRSDLQTIASRRVLACPASLPTADGYILTMAARKALENYGYHINLKADDRPYGASDKVTCRLRMQPHPGMVLLRDNVQPIVWSDWTTWPSWFQTIASIFLGLVIMDALRLTTTQFLRQPKASEPATSGNSAAPTLVPEPLPSSYATLDAQLADYENQIDERTHLALAAEFAVWDERLRETRKGIRRASGLTDAEREVLWKRYQILAFELNASAKSTHTAAAGFQINSPAGTTDVALPAAGGAAKKPTESSPPS